MRFDRKKFFDGFRDRLDSTIEQGQVDGLEFLLAGFENDDRWADIRHIAYALATIFHETAYSFQPVVEGYYLAKTDPPDYGGKTKRVRDFQKKLRYYPFFGRGYVQLTWKENYAKAGKTLGLDLVNKPELALDPTTAFRILTEGLFRGWFGGKLTTYINAKETDYVNARRCVNVLDKAGVIAGYARSFEKILRTSATDPTPGGSSDSPAAINTTTIGPANDPQTPAGGTPLPDANQPTAAPPGDAVTVPPVVTENTATVVVSKAHGWYAALPAGVTSFLGGVVAWFQGASTEIVAGFFGATALIGMTWIITNQWAKTRAAALAHQASEKQKDRDFELTKLQMMSAMDDKKTTVLVKPPATELPGSESSAGSSDLGQ